MCVHFFAFQKIKGGITTGKNMSQQFHFHCFKFIFTFPVHFHCSKFISIVPNSFPLFQINFHYFQFIFTIPNSFPRISIFVYKISMIMSQKLRSGYPLGITGKHRIDSSFCWKFHLFHIWRLHFKMYFTLRCRAAIPHS